MNITQINQLLDIEPQMVALKDGVEPSLRDVLRSYYSQGGHTTKECAKLVDEYVWVLAARMGA